MIAPISMFSREGTKYTRTYYTLTKYTRAIHTGHNILDKRYPDTKYQTICTRPNIRDKIYGVKICQPKYTGQNIPYQLQTNYTLDISVRISARIRIRFRARVRFRVMILMLGFGLEVRQNGQLKN